MYFTDEFMDEWGEALDRSQTTDPETHEGHDVGMELIGNNPNGPEVLVCRECRVQLGGEPQ